MCVRGWVVAKRNERKELGKKGEWKKKRTNIQKKSQPTILKDTSCKFPISLADTSSVYS